MLNVYQEIVAAKVKGKKLFAVLIDPDNDKKDTIKSVLKECIKNKVDFVFVGGSTAGADGLDEFVLGIRKLYKNKIVLFLGNLQQISKNADALLLPSLISGRNPDLLIGQHVIAAPLIKKSKLEVIPMGYILVDGGSVTSVQYLSNTLPIPANKPSIASATAMAGEMLGLKLIYLEAGSGAKKPVNEATIRQVKKSCSLPLIVGGGITTLTQAEEAYSAGADLIVIGNAIEEDVSLITKVSSLKKKINASK